VRNLSVDLRKDVKRRIEGHDYNCEKELTLSILSGKWKIVIFYHLGVQGALRFSEIRRLFPKITHKMLTNQLRELEEDEVIQRHVYPEVPPRVEYSLTELGKSLMPIIEMMYDWGKLRVQQIQNQTCKK
jgi:DNA-binding HxlR family transcriptional regulator